jgi:hypothetical protein
MPVSSDGFASRTIAAVKNAYITTTQSTHPTIQSAWATPARPVKITISLPKTHVPATTVKKPGPRAWLFKSSTTRGKKAKSRIASMTVNTAYATTLTASSTHEIRGMRRTCAAIDTIPVAMTRAK